MSKGTERSSSTTAPRVKLFPEYLYSGPPHGSSAPDAQAANTRAITLLALLILGAGVAVRAIQFLANRSLRRDEASLANNLLERSYSELLQPLDYGQVAPFGFLWAQRLALDLFGASEYALRFFPFLAGCAALVLFWAVARRFLSPAAALFALALFAASPLLIFYTVDNKPYSFDVAVSLVLLLLALRIVQQGATMRRSLALGVVGSVGVWFSHPAVFLMAGLALGLSAQPLLARQWQRLRPLALTYTLWALSAAPAVWLARRHSISPEGLAAMEAAWETRGFVPVSSTSRADLLWFPRAVRDIFSTELLAFPLYWLAALVFLAGGLWAWRQQRTVLLCLLLPMAAVLGASALHLYPFHGRLILFLVPAFLLLIAAGTGEATTRWLQWGRGWISGALAAALLLPWAYVLAAHLPFSIQEIRPAMQYVSAHRAAGDALYVHWGADRAFPFYAARYGISPAEYELGTWARPTGEFLTSEFERYRGRGRTWILFSHSPERPSRTERQQYLEHLDRIGTRLDWFEHAGGSVYLYDLR